VQRFTSRLSRAIKGSKTELGGELFGASAHCRTDGTWPAMLHAAPVLRNSLAAKTVAASIGKGETHHLGGGHAHGGLGPSTMLRELSGFRASMKLASRSGARSPIPEIGHCRFWRSGHSVKLVAPRYTSLFEEPF